MEFVYAKLNRDLPDEAVEKIVAFEPNSRWYEEHRKPNDLTVWYKHSLRREIEHGTCNLIKRFVPWKAPRLMVPIFGSPRLRPIKTVETVIRNADHNEGQEEEEA